MPNAAQYKANQAHYIEAALKRYRENQAHITAYKLLHPCACGASNPLVLTFDHNDPKLKKFELGSAGSRSIKLIDAEMAKCTVRCANCHILQHAEHGRPKGGRPRKVNVGIPDPPSKPVLGVQLAFDELGV